MTDRFAAMQPTHDGPCPTCGARPDGVPVYKPQHAKALSDEALTAHRNYTEREGAPQS